MCAETYLMQRAASRTVGWLICFAENNTRLHASLQIVLTANAAARGSSEFLIN